MRDSNTKSRVLLLYMSTLNVGRVGGENYMLRSSLVFKEKGISRNIIRFWFLGQRFHHCLENNHPKIYQNIVYHCN